MSKVAIIKKAIPSRPKSFGVSSLAIINSLSRPIALSNILRIKSQNPPFATLLERGISDRDCCSNILVSLDKHILVAPIYAASHALMNNSSLMPFLESGTVDQRSVLTRALKQDTRRFQLHFISGSSTI